MSVRFSVCVGLLLSSSALAAPKQDAADKRASETEAKMTDDERFQLLHSLMPIPLAGPVNVPKRAKPSAGFVTGIARLGIPDITETDASLGVTNPGGLRQGDVATALPSGLSLASTFNPDVAAAGGYMVGTEAKAKGFNVLLGGGANLTRDYYGGRNFEYLGEDPLLAGLLAGASIRGAQKAGVVSTVKHFSLNPQETQRHSSNAIITEAGHRESDLLAFQIAIEKGKPGSVMCAYNKVGGKYACGSDHLLNTVLKNDWGYKGWVMSDWGAAYDVSYFNAGLDQQSGAQFDKQIWFDKPLKAEFAAGRVTRGRLSDAVQRILRSLYAVGADKAAATKEIDYKAHAEVAREAAAEGIVLLKNDGALPLANEEKSILVVGGYADVGVMSGAGSSQVTPVGGPATLVPVGGPGLLAFMGKQLIVPSSPLNALKAALPKAKISFDGGYFPEAAAANAASADMVVVFATQWQVESLDGPTLALPNGQDALISALAEANPNVVVVLETGNPIAMPWLNDVKAVVEAWYPGQKGGEAIADVLTGRVNPSGRLPMTFPASASQAPRPDVPGLGMPDRSKIDINYVEGSDVGYRWYAAKKHKPLFPFGFGMSYTKFEHGALSVKSGKKVTASFTVKNVGKKAGADVPQLYLTDAAGRAVHRLVGFQKLMLQPGESRDVSLEIDPRLLASWNGKGWLRAAGTYGFALGTSATQLADVVSVKLRKQTLKP